MARGQRLRGPGDALAQAIGLGWNWGDLDAFGELMHDDVVLAPDAGFPDAGQELRGRTAARAWYARVHAPVVVHSVRERGEQVFATFSWLGGGTAAAGVTWSVLLSFTAGRVARIEYFRSLSAGECAWADATGAHFSSPTMCAAFQANAAARPDQIAIAAPADGSVISWATYGRQVRALSTGLSALGVRAGDRVAVYLRHRPEFHLVLTAAIHLGAVPSPIHEGATAEHVERVLADGRCVLAFTERELAPVVRAAIAHAGDEIPVILTDGGGRERTLADVMLSTAPRFDFDAAWRGIRGEDELMTVYPSPASGRTEPISVTHDQVIRTYREVQREARITPGGRVLTGAPAAHPFDRLMIHQQQLLLGHTVNFFATARAMALAARKVRPTLWVTPAAVLDELRALAEKDAAEPERLRRAMTLGRWRIRAAQRGERLDAARQLLWETAEREVLAPLRERLGLDAEGVVHVAGGAGVPDELRQFHAALGITLLDAAPLSSQAFDAVARAGTLTTPRPQPRRAA